MKKLFAVLLILLTVLLVGCGSDEPEAEPENTPVILSKGDGFEVLMIESEDYSIKYAYTVTAADGTVIEKASCSNQPKVAKLDNGLIGIRFTTDNKVFCRYYDIKNGLASDSYFGAFWDNGKLVAYNSYEDTGKLVVCDIFNPDGYRFEKEIQSSAMELIVTGSSVNDKGTELKVTYKMGESAGEQSTTLPLVKAEG